MSNEVELDTFISFFETCIIILIMFPIKLICFVIDANKERFCTIFHQLKQAMW